MRACTRLHALPPSAGTPCTPLTWCSRRPPRPPLCPGLGGRLCQEAALQLGLRQQAQGAVGRRALGQGGPGGRAPGGRAGGRAGAGRAGGRRAGGRAGAGRAGRRAAGGQVAWPRHNVSSQEARGLASGHQAPSHSVRLAWACVRRGASATGLEPVALLLPALSHPPCPARPAPAYVPLPSPRPPPSGTSWCSARSRSGWAGGSDLSSRVGGPGRARRRSPAALSAPLRPPPPALWVFRLLWPRRAFKHRFLGSSGCSGGHGGSRTFGDGARRPAPSAPACDGPRVSLSGMPLAPPSVPPALLCSPARRAPAPPAGGAPLSRHVEDFLRVTMCCRVVQGYGLTETCAASFIAVPDVVVSQLVSHHQHGAASFSCSTASSAVARPAPLVRCPCAFMFGGGGAGLGGCGPPASMRPRLLKTPLAAAGGTAD